MTYLNDGYFAAGGVLSPLTPSLSNSLLKDADPAIYYMLDFYAAVLGLHLGPRWNAEVTALGRTDLSNLTVANKVPFDPIPYLQESQFKFPLLAVYRKSERYEWHTVNRYRLFSVVNVVWIMPPMTAGQMERMAPFRAHAARTLVDRTAMGFDSNYSSGLNVWDAAGIDKIGISSNQFGNIPTDTGLIFPTILMECNLVESQMPVSEPGHNLQAFNGMDGYVFLTEDAVIVSGDFEVDIKT